MMKRCLALAVFAMLIALFPAASLAEDHVEQLLSGMTVEQKVYQMFIVAPETLENVSPTTAATKKTAAALESYPVGGIIYFAANLKSPKQAHTMLADVQQLAKDAGMPGLLLGVDEEGGTVARCASKLGTTKFPPMMTLAKNNDPQLIYEAYQTIANDISGIGFNLDFAPVADVVTSTKNTEIGNRAFGTDAQTVSAMVEAAVKGLGDQGVGSVTKHFPGHGASVTNTHSDRSEVKRTLEELRELELIPFAKAIEAGTDMILLSHLTPTNIDDSAPSSLNRTIVTDLLRGEMGYAGIAITDALRMQAITRYHTSEQVVELGIEAGIDIFLLPANFKKASAHLIKMVKDGQISEARIDESVRRILSLKSRLALLD